MGRIYPQNRFIPGTKKIECPRCGWDFLESELIYEERTKAKVCQKCYDPPHEQDEPRIKRSNP